GAQIFAIFSRLTPCQPGASPPSVRHRISDSERSPRGGIGSGTRASSGRRFDASDVVAQKAEPPSPKIFSKHHERAIIARIGLLPKEENMRTILMGFLWLAVAAPAGAQMQITTGVIEGVVVDTSGAVLPGVDVEVRNVDTNVSRTLVTDRDGRFVALQLQPGRYTVTFKLAGFATLVQE